MSNDPQIIQPEGWIRPKGYSNGVAATGRWLFVAGQIGWDTAGTFAGADLVAQFDQALANVVAVVAAAGGAPTDIASMTIYVTDVVAYRAAGKALGAIWRARLGKHYPAMALVAVTALVEPAAVVEIQAFAMV